MADYLLIVISKRIVKVEQIVTDLVSHEFALTGNPKR